MKVLINIIFLFFTFQVFSQDYVSCVSYNTKIIASGLKSGGVSTKTEFVFVSSVNDTEISGMYIDSCYLRKDVRLNSGDSLIICYTHYRYYEGHRNIENNPGYNINKPVKNCTIQRKEKTIKADIFLKELPEKSYSFSYVYRGKVYSVILPDEIKDIAKMP